MDRLEELRGKIDNIDDKIADLFNERMNVCREIGKEKAEREAAVSDYGREKSIINRVAGRVDEDKILYAKQVYETLFGVSKAYQTQFVDTRADLRGEVLNALDKAEDFPVSATVACQGIEGAYSSLACEKLFPVSNILYFKNWDAVFSAIESGICEYGILPIENSTAGSVYTIYDLMLKHRFYVVRTVRLQIKHSLLAKKGTSIKDVRVIYSHKQALAQCAEYLKGFPQAEIVEVENTAVAARMVKESARADVACISSPECEDIYSLTTLERCVQDVGNNYTRFICITKDMRIYPGADKISIVMSLPHVTGALSKVLSKFCSLGLNLTKLESRPIANREFEFAFYFDFEGDVKKKEVLNLLAGLSLSCDEFTFLGAYKEVL